MPKYKTYDDLFDETLDTVWRETFDPEIAIPGILSRKFKELDIILTEEQLAQIAGNLGKSYDSFHLELSDEQLHGSSIQPDDEGKYQLKIDLTDEAERLEQLESEIPKLLEGLIQQATKEWAKEKYQEFIDIGPSMLLEEREIQESFQTILRSTWGKALDTLNIFLILVTEAGHDVASEYVPFDPDKPDYVFHVLTGLHARACQIGKEVHTLLSAGLADGAHARWRSLHEVSVVASFIRDHGQEVAERYLLHSWIESKKGAHQHVEYESRLNEPAPTGEELRILDEEYKSLLKRFGKTFATPYGWAASVLKNPSPKFADIERVVGLDHLRPYYRLASYNVHANPKGMLFRLGAAPDTEWLLAGPSVYGLADPGHGTAISLLQITTNLLSYETTIDKLVRLSVLIELEREIGDSFHAAHASLNTEQ